MNYASRISVRPIAAAFVPVLASFGFTTGASAVEFDGRLPFWKGRIVFRAPGTGTYPKSTASLLEKCPGTLLMDPVLGTLRFFAPKEPLQLYRPGERGELSLATVARRFIDENREVFGVGSMNLLPAAEYPVDHGNVLLVFRVTAGDLPIAGANIRMVISGRDGDAEK